MPQRQDSDPAPGGGAVMTSRDGSTGNVVAFAPAAARRSAVSKGKDFARVFNELTVQCADTRTVRDTPKATDDPLVKRIYALRDWVVADREARQKRAEARTDVVVAFMLPAAPGDTRPRPSDAPLPPFLPVDARP